MNNPPVFRDTPGLNLIDVSGAEGGRRGLTATDGPWAQAQSNINFNISAQLAQGRSQVSETLGEQAFRELGWQFNTPAHQFQWPVYEHPDLVESEIDLAPDADRWGTVDLDFSISTGQVGMYGIAAKWNKRQQAAAQSFAAATGGSPPINESRLYRLARNKVRLGLELKKATYLTTLANYDPTLRVTNGTPINTGGGGLDLVNTGASALQGLHPTVEHEDLVYILSRKAFRAHLADPDFKTHLANTSHARPNKQTLAEYLGFKPENVLVGDALQSTTKTATPTSVWGSCGIIAMRNEPEPGVEEPEVTERVPVAQFSLQGAHIGLAENPWDNQLSVELPWIAETDLVQVSTFSAYLILTVGSL